MTTAFLSDRKGLNGHTAGRVWGGGGGGGGHMGSGQRIPMIYWDVLMCLPKWV